MTGLFDATIVEVNRADTPVCLRLAASLAGKIAADFGARVVKVEPPGGDVVRGLPPHIDGRGAVRGSALFEFLNTGKESVVLDPDVAEDAAALDRLTQGADGVIEEGAASDAAPGDGVRVHLTAFGGSRDMAGMPASELTVLALGGLLDMIGDPERAPLRLGGHQAAYSAGLAAFTALAAAVIGRRRHGRGEICDVSLLDAVLWLNWKAPAGALFLGRAPRREGPLAEWQVMPCADGHVALVYVDRDWPGLCRLVGEPRLAEPPFDTATGRRSNRDTLVALLRGSLSRFTRAELFAGAKAGRIPIGPVLTPRELLDDAQYLARDFIATLAHPTYGDLALPHLPVMWNGRRFAPRPAPALATT